MTAENPDHRVLFYAPDVTVARGWMDTLKAEGIPFDPVLWQPGMPPIGAPLGIVRMPPPELFKAEPNLTVLFNMGAGMDAILRIPDLSPGLKLVRIEDGGMAGMMCEYVVHAVAEIARGMPAYRAAQDEARWQPQPCPPRQRWPIGVMGLGAIGGRIAHVLAMLGYPARGWARSPRSLQDVECFHGREQLDPFLAGTRILVNVLPLTDATRGILDRRVLRQLPQGSHVINIGRGEHIEENALLECLDDGHIASAVLDVFRTEPLPAAHRLWRHPGVSITPHISGSTDTKAAIRQIARNILAFRRNEAMTGLVDRKAGY